MTLDQTYLPPAVGQGFTGSVLLAPMNVAGATAWGFANSQVGFQKTRNKSYPALQDGVGEAHNSVSGKREGTLRITSALMPDRDVAGFLNSNFGVRDANGNLVPLCANIKRFAGAGIEKASLVYPDRCIIYGRDGQRGQDAMVMMDILCIVVDPDNILGAPTLAPPATFGQNGLGISSFIGAQVTNSASVSYDVLQSWSVTLMNRYVRVPGVVPGTRIGAGCKPGQFIGALTVGQTTGANFPVPATGSLGPMSLLIPTGDGSKTLTLDMSCSDDDTATQYAPQSFVSGSETYTLFSSSSANGTGAIGHPIVSTYA